MPALAQAENALSAIATPTNALFLILTRRKIYSGLSFVQIAIPGHAGVDRGAPSSLALALSQDHAEMIGISWLAVGSHVIHVCAARRVTSASHQTKCCSENERSQHCTPVSSRDGIGAVFSRNLGAERPEADLPLPSRGDNTPTSGVDGIG